MKTKHVYVAAPWARRWEAAAVANTLEQEGFLITRKWWLHEAGDIEHDKLREQAQADLDAVIESDVLLLLNLEQSEGKAVEQGIALMNVLPIVAIGKPSNIFHHLDDYKWVSTIEEAIECLMTL